MPSLMTFLPWIGSEVRPSATNPLGSGGDGGADSVDNEHGIIYSGMTQMEGLRSRVRPGGGAGLRTAGQRMGSE
jgi:hypothetical protein